MGETNENNRSSQILPYERHSIMVTDGGDWG